MPLNNTVATKDNWTTARVQQLTKLWADGKSCSQIAILMGGGITRNSVIGKVTRLKLPRHSHNFTRTPPHRPPQAKAPASVRRASGSGNRGGGRAFKIAEARKQGLTGPEAMEAVLGRPAVPFEEPDEGVDYTDRIGLLEFTADTCKWPMNTPWQPPYKFCGAQTLEGRPWCPEHNRRAHQTISQSPAESAEYRMAKRAVSDGDKQFGGAV